MERIYLSLKPTQRKELRYGSEAARVLMILPGPLDPAIPEVKDSVARAKKFFPPF